MTHLDSILMRLEANHLRLTGGDGGQSFPSEIAAALREQAGEIERWKQASLRQAVTLNRLTAEEGYAEKQLEETIGTLHAVIDERDTLASENAGLRKLLSEAADTIAEWGGYAGSYFQRKHNLNGDINRFRDAALSITEEPGSC